MIKGVRVVIQGVYLCEYLVDYGIWIEQMSILGILGL